jgi:uncharacterized protein DUF1236
MWFVAPARPRVHRMPEEHVNTAYEPAKEARAKPKPALAVGLCGRSIMAMKQTVGALAVTLAIGLAPAASQTGGFTEPSTALQLNAQQRAQIYEAVGKSKLRTPPPPDIPVTVGAQIPPVTELYALPESVTAEVPSAKFYRYTVAQNRVIIVDPINLKVIDVIRP